MNPHPAWSALVLAVTLVMWPAQAGGSSPATPPDTGRLVVVVDRTDGAWGPVGPAVHGWSASKFVHLVQRDACNPDAYCVVLTTVHAGPTPWGANTVPRTLWRARITLNDDTLRSWPTPAGRSAVLCHEIGHALGIDHPTPAEAASNRDVHGCITAADPANVTPVASPSDLRKLGEVATGLGHRLTFGAMVTYAPSYTPPK